jgi:hypothetical protein
MIKLEISMNDTEHSTEEIKAALCYQDAYCAINNIHSMFRSLTKHGTMFGLEEEITPEQSEIVEKIADRFYEIIKDLPELP